MQDELIIKVELRGRYGNFYYATEVPAMLREAFGPLKTCDDPMIAFATGETVAGSAHAVKKVELRKDAADILSKEIAEALVSYMQKDDTHNGYKSDD